MRIEQVKEIVKRRNSRIASLSKACALQQRIRFHTEPNLSSADAGIQATLFLDWVKTLLPLDKFNVFVQLFRFPLPTSALVEDIYHELEKVFYSRNASFDYSFTDNKYNEDWLRYRSDKLHEPDVWKVVGWNKMKVSPNSLLVVDLPVKQTTPLPEPYFYWLEIDDVIDYELTPDGKAFRWVAFKQPEKRIAIFDDKEIAVYQLSDKEELVEKPIVLTEHDLGYTPVRFFWTTFINTKDKDVKSNPLTKELANLDWLLFFAISKRHLDTYAAYPIYSAYKADCDFENNETGEYCDGGFLRDIDGNYQIMADGSVKPCPICSKRRIAGAGSFVEVPVPNNTEGVADMRDPVQITTIDRESLDYNVDEVNRLSKQIRDEMVGSGGDIENKQAINEMQVNANFESRTAVLNSLKTNFEEAQRFVEDTICRLRYGNAYKGLSVSWGTEFYLYTVEELYSKYKQAREAGASQSELDAISKQIMEVEYRNNPTLLKRMSLLRQLEPFPNMKVTELETLRNTGLMNSTQFLIKLNFTAYIDRFERENTDIVEFGINQPLRDKIKTISDKIKEYANQDEQEILRAGGSVGATQPDAANQRGAGGGLDS